MLDCIARMVPGVLSDDVCFTEESHFSGLLEYPQYTRPAVWEGRRCRRFCCPATMPTSRNGGGAVPPAYPSPSSGSAGIGGADRKGTAFLAAQAEETGAE